MTNFNQYDYSKLNFALPPKEWYEKNGYTLYNQFGNYNMNPDGTVKVSSSDSTIEGRKFDGGKLEYGLLPPLALEETVKVLTFGAQKYERDNWQKVPDSKRRYFDAMQRHAWAWKQGEQLDPESGIHHLAHAMCCSMFLYEHDIMYSLNNGDVNEAVK
jgi:hypothetical protein